MEIKTFDVVTVSKFPKFGKPLPDKDSKALSKTVKIERTVPKVFEIPNISKLESESLKEEKEITAEDLIKDYDEIVKRASSVIDIVKGRLKNVSLFMPVSSSEDPTTYSFLRRLFSGSVQGLSFEDYMKLLEYRAELDSAIAELP